MKTRSESPSHPAQPGALLPDLAMLRHALPEALRKLDPRVQWRNPVMFVVYVGSILTTVLSLTRPDGFTVTVACWLWFTVLFANLAEALAEGRSKAMAGSLRGLRQDLTAWRLPPETSTLPEGAAALGSGSPARDLPGGSVGADALRRDDRILVRAGEIIPIDGEILDGVASVDESAITGESAPVIRESGGDFSSVTGGTRVLSDVILVRVSADPGQTFIDRMIAMVEGAARQKTPNEIALTILLAAMTLVFLGVTVTLLPFSAWSAAQSGHGEPVRLAVLVALLVCLIPTTIAGLLSAIGVAGMGRLMQANVVARSGRAVEAAGDVDVLLLDKTGTITLGNRQATAFHAAPGVQASELAAAARMASLADSTPEGRSIVLLADGAHGGAAPEAAAEAARDASATAKTLPGTPVDFTAQTRMSGLDLPGGRQLRKGATDAVRRHVEALGGTVPDAVVGSVEDVSRRGGTPLVVSDEARVLGVIELSDVVKPGIRTRFAELRRMGIRTVMVTGDNPLTAAAIAAEAGVDDFMAEATPEEKLERIRAEQAAGHMVAMTGDGTNDAPALAQADVAVAMNSGTQAAKEAGNMVDLDSNPTKLIEIVTTGKQLLMTRGALTTFSISNDVAKYFAIIPAALTATYPQLETLNVMHLASPDSAILSAVIFNALIIILLIPLALRGVRSRAQGAAALLRRNLLVFGLGGLVVPFVGIKLIDLLLVAGGLV